MKFPMTLSQFISTYQVQLDDQDRVIHPEMKGFTGSHLYFPVGKDGLVYETLPKENRVGWVVSRYLK